MRFKVIYQQDITITREAIVKADSEEQAMDKACAGDSIHEKEIERKVIENRPNETERLNG
ncbi:hypothetical protein [Evansella clarkii]|uniref:hypothetical protein n=1 Tax=Evansella clarkii TaxID=79879 RepID=UPI000998A116|nr:hypothetical protein [Evansella clarkii]